MTQKWQPIETAPLGENNPILVWDGYDITVAHGSKYSNGVILWWVHNTYDEDGQITGITYWMPLPKPP